MIDLKKQNKYKGYQAEDLASSFLLNKGYQILEKNFLIRGGEIDLVAKKDEVLVFVEVKARYSHNFGLPEESITPWKLRSLLKTALFYNQKINWGNRPFRIDCVFIDYPPNRDNPKIDHLENITL